MIVWLFVVILVLDAAVRVNHQLIFPVLYCVSLFFPAKVVDLDPCLTKKQVEESACHPYNTRGSMSEVQSLSSFQSESCDDNGMQIIILLLTNIITQTSSCIYLVTAFKVQSQVYKVAVK